MMRGMRLAFASLALLPSLAVAQQMPPPDDRSIDIQLFEPALGTHSFLTVTGAEVMSRGQFQLALGLTYLTHPFTVFVVEEGDLERRSEVISSIFAGSLSFAYGITNSLQAGVQLPVILAMRGDGLDASTGMAEPGGLSVTGLGDARLEAVWRFYDRSRMVLAAVPAITVPTSTKIGGDDDAFLGDSVPTFRPRLAWQMTSADGKLTGGANLGVIIRKPRTVYSSEVGQQITYGAALGYDIGKRLEIMGEIFGRKGFASSLDESPLEADLALRIAASPSLSIQAGGGAGLIRGVGAPAARFFAGVSWAPDFRDNDADRIANMEDRCPNQAEDKDGYQDEDGCPDLDNDVDGVGDEGDRCAMDAEDKDGFEDEDGCPELDNDKDGITDLSDGCPDAAEDKLPPRADDGCPQSRGDNDGDGVSDDKDTCPTEFEDMDGFKDEDGCPDADNDGDGLPDASDQCPVEAEDKDGFKDEDGCAEPDNDNDGVADAKDRCPSEAEVINGVKDDDGCPDTGGKVLASLQGARVVLASPVAFDKGRVRSASKKTLDQVALVMNVRADVGKWSVTVSDPKKALADERAAAIKSHLVGKGVPAARIDAAGAEGAANVEIRATQKADGTAVPADGPEPEPVIEIDPT
jgi:OOP family OmpA-OmpF porin